LTLRGEGVEQVEGVTPNGVAFSFKLGRKDDFLEIINADGSPDLRRALLQRGGIEMVNQTWFLARDRRSVVIEQWDGTSHEHTLGRGGKLGLPCPAKAGELCDETCDHSITCNSPACQQFFSDDWRRAHPVVNVSSPYKPAPRSEYVPIASPVKAQRPLTVTEHEAKIAHAAEECTSLANSAAVGKAIADALQPHLYQETAKRK